MFLELTLMGVAGLCMGAGMSAHKQGAPRSWVRGFYGVAVLSLVAAVVALIVT